jgi:hypothetical protein
MVVGNQSPPDRVRLLTQPCSIRKEDRSSPLLLANSVCYEVHDLPRDPY